MSERGREGLAIRTVLVCALAPCGCLCLTLGPSQRKGHSVPWMDSCRRAPQQELLVNWITFDPLSNTACWTAVLQLLRCRTLLPTFQGDVASTTPTPLRMISNSAAGACPFSNHQASLTAAHGILYVRVAAQAHRAHIFFKSVFVSDAH